MRVFEPSRPVARRVRELLAASDELAVARAGPDWFATTGELAPFRSLAQRIVPAEGAEFARIEARLPSPA